MGGGCLGSDEFNSERIYADLDILHFLAFASQLDFSAADILICTSTSRVFFLACLFCSIANHPS